MTSQPSAASISAMLAPMPRLDPVTSATLPVSAKSMTQPHTQQVMKTIEVIVWTQSASWLVFLQFDQGAEEVRRMDESDSPTGSVAAPAITKHAHALAAQFGDRLIHAVDVEAEVMNAA